MQQEGKNGETENKPHQFAGTHAEAPARIQGIERETKMDCERAVENNGSWHTVPDEIMNSSTPLHCLERDIAKRMHAKVQREIGEHDETSCEAKPTDRHLVAEYARIYHLTSPPSQLSIVPLGICGLEGRTRR